MMALLVVVPSATGVTGAFLFGFLAEEVRSDLILEVESGSSSKFSTVIRALFQLKLDICGAGCQPGCILDTDSYL